MISIRRIRAHVMLHQRKDVQRAALSVIDFSKTVYRRRVLFYAMLLALALFVLMILNPSVSAHAVTLYSQALTVSLSPKDIIDNGVQGNPDFLAFNRWLWANDLPSPNSGIFAVGAAISSGVRSIASFVMILPAAIFWVIGLVLHVGFGAVNYAGVTRQADEWFALSYRAILDSTSNSTGLGAGMTLLVLAFIAAIIIGIIALVFRRPGIMGALVFAFFMSVLVFLAGSQSERNLDANDEYLERGGNYQTLSAGWMLEKIDQTVGVLSSTLNGVVSSISDALGEVDSDQQISSSYAAGACGHYVDAMHTLYESGYNEVGSNLGDAFWGGTGTRNNLSIVTAYDGLYLSSMRSLYNSAAFGVGSSTSNAWCRIADMNAGRFPASSVLISEQAGLYQDIIHNAHNLADNGMINNDMSWNTQGREQAEVFFGTGRMSTAATNSYAYYFAACRWTDDGNNISNGVTVDRWRGVAAASEGKDDQPWWTPPAVRFAFWVADNLDDSPDVINRDACIQSAIDPYMKGKVFDYTLEPEDFIWGALTFTVSQESALSSWFFIEDGDEATVAQEPFRYWSSLNGFTSPMLLLVSGTLMLIIALVVLKNLAPLVLAAVSAPFLQSIAAMLLPIGAVLGMIPIKNFQRPVKLMILVILFSALTILVFGLVLSFGIMLIHLIYRILTSMAGILSFNDSLQFLQFIMVGTSVLVGTWALKFILSKVFAVDMSSFKSAFKTGLLASGGAALAQAGMGGAGMQNPWGSMLNSPKGGRSLGDRAKSAGSGLANRAANKATGFIGDKAGEIWKGVKGNLTPKGKPGDIPNPGSGVATVPASGGMPTKQDDPLKAIGRFANGRDRFQLGPGNDPNKPALGPGQPPGMNYELEELSRSNPQVQKQLDRQALDKTLAHSGHNPMNPEISAAEQQRLVDAKPIEALGYSSKDQQDAERAVGPLVFQPGADGVYRANPDDLKDPSLLNEVGTGFTGEAFRQHVDNLETPQNSGEYGDSFADRTLTQATTFGPTEPMIDEEGRVKPFVELPVADVNHSNVEATPTIGAIALPNPNDITSSDVPTSLVEALRSTDFGGTQDAEGNVQLERAVEDMSRGLETLNSSIQDSVNTLGDRLPNGAIPIPSSNMSSHMMDEGRQVGERLSDEFVDSSLRTFSEGLAIGIQGGQDLRESEMERAITFFSSEVAHSEQMALDLSRSRPDDAAFDISALSQQVEENVKPVWFSDIPDLARQRHTGELQAGESANERLVRRTMKRLLGKDDE